MYERIEFCPSCKNTQFNNQIICTDYSVTEESFALVKCTKCQLIFTNPRPDKDSISAFYKSDQYISHTDKANTLINKLYKIIRNYTTSQKVKLVNQYAKTKTVLDYGCGTGFFLSKAQTKGYHTLGFEPDHQARTIAKQSGAYLLDDLNVKEKVSVITAWHVIEHVHDLHDTLKALIRLLEPNGTMIIAVPNINSFDAKYYKEHWAAYDVPRHLYHFTKESFGTLIAKHKLKIIKTIPMKFDSYYVALLSEKYKTGKTNYLNALKVGRKSNQEAKKTGEYSSLIYILKKQ